MTCRDKIDLENYRRFKGLQVVAVSSPLFRLFSTRPKGFCRLGGNCGYHMIFDQAYDHLSFIASCHLEINYRAKDEKQF